MEQNALHFEHSLSIFNCQLSIKRNNKSLFRAYYLKVISMKRKKLLKAYKTLALAEKEKIDKARKTSNPSEENVEITREWSKENKL